MSRKIIGVTVGSSLPKPNFKQTDPTKGDYIKNKPDFEGLKTQVNAVSDLVGDTKVSDQIADAVNKLDKIYKQNDEPVGAEEGALWLDMDEEGGGSGINDAIKSYVDTAIADAWVNVARAEEASF